MKDRYGKEYLRWEHAEAGMLIEIDGGFDCQEAGKYTLACDEVSQLPYFHCCQGRHYLAGQVEKGYVIGVYPA